MCDEPSQGLCPVSFLDNLDVCDLENYKHPPFMWILWYLSLIGKAAYDKIMELLNQEGGDEDKGKKEEKDEGDKAEAEEAPPEEAPAEEEGAAEEEAPAEDAAEEEA